MNISKRVREEAAMLCSAAACNVPKSFIFESLGYSLATLALVQAAYFAAPRSAGDDSHRLEWAEAEAMLRCGWSP